MIVLCAFNKGGVGKTSLAVHMAGLFASRKQRTLIVDCDEQHDAWTFLARRQPNDNYELFHADPYLSALWNKSRDSIRHVASGEEYDHFVLDVDTPKKNTVQAILQNDPHLVLLPVNDQALALQHLGATLNVVAGLREIMGFAPLTILQPLGVTKEKVKATLEQLPSKPPGCLLAPPIKPHPRQFAMALQRGKFVWNYKDCEYLYSHFQKLANKAEEARDAQLAQDN